MKLETPPDGADFWKGIIIAVILAMLIAVAVNVVCREKPEVPAVAGK